MQAAPRASCFGKLPTRGDFVRSGAGGRAMREFDAWVQRGVAEAQRRLGPGLADAFEQTGATCFFVEVPNAPHALAGAFRPSRDRTGRRYPFLVAVEVEKRDLDGRRIPSWPDRYERFFRAAVTLVNDAVDGRLADAELEPTLRTLRSVYDRTSFPVDYEFRLRQTAAADLWARTWGEAEDGRKYVTVKNLTEAFARNGHARTTRLPAAFRVPLPSSPRALDVSFWLEACWRLLGAAPSASAFFWSAGEGAELVIAPVPPPSDALVHLFTGDGSLPLLDDSEGQPAALAALALPAQYGTLLEEDDLSLHAFLQRMS